MSLRNLFKFTLGFMVVISLHASSEDGKVEQPSLSRVSALEAKLENLFNKAGIEFNGTFNSRLFYSVIDDSSPALNKNIPGNVEDLLVTTTDLEIIGRPSAALQGKALIRIHRDWASGKKNNPVFVRSVNMSGKLTDYFQYQFGTLHKKFSKLTLYTPQIDIMYEPSIFSERRSFAESEVFLKDNQRLLDGLNLDFGIGLNPLIKDINVSGVFSRLRASYNLSDENTIWSEATNITPTAIKLNYLPNANQKKWLFSKYLGTGNINIEIVDDLEVGAAFMTIFDMKGTFKPPKDDTLDYRKTVNHLQQNTSVVSLHGGIGTGNFIDTSILNIRVKGEFANSNDKILDSVDYKNNITPDTKTVTGNALLIDLLASFSIGDMGKISFDGGVTRNEANFRNELAQSPSFLKNRIMNSDNDNKKAGTLYSTFDALYNSSFYFVPKDSSNNFAKSPMMKNAYNNIVYMQRELNYIDSISSYDPSLQLVMPQGPATPNRSGFNGKIHADLLKEMLSVTASFQSMTELESMDSSTDKKASFSQFGAGGVVRLGNVLYAGKRTLLLSGSFSTSSMTNGHLKMAFKNSEITSNFLNLGAEWNFWRQFSLMGGLQSIKTDFKALNSTKELTCNQMQWATGLKYKISDGGTIGFTYGAFDISYTGKNHTEAEDPSKKDFSGKQYDLYVNVNF